MLGENKQKCMYLYQMLDIRLLVRKERCSSLWLIEWNPNLNLQGKHIRCLKNDVN